MNGSEERTFSKITGCMLFYKQSKTQKPTRSILNDKLSIYLFRSSSGYKVSYRAIYIYIRMEVITTGNVPIYFTMA